MTEQSQTGESKCPIPDEEFIGDAAIIDMLDFQPGDVWETASGKVFDVMGRAFIWGGKRWVPVWDRDFDRPTCASIADLEIAGARCH